MAPRPVLAPPVPRPLDADRPEPLGDRLRPHVDLVAAEIAAEIRRRIPAYAEAADTPAGRELHATVAASVRGFVDALATERERHRARLRDALVADPPTGREAIGELCRAAGWDAPDTIAAVALRTPAGAAARLVPPAVLADWPADAPYLVVPDPGGPGRERLLAALTESCPGAIGPTVELDRGAVSLRWARRAVALMADGALPEAPAVRCVDHLPTLLASVGHELVDAAAPRYLRPLLDQPSPRREMLAETLLVYCSSGDDAVLTGRRLHVHPQTVRYRMRVIRELFGGEIADPDDRLGLMIVLNALLRRAPGPL